MLARFRPIIRQGADAKYALAEARGATQFLRRYTKPMSASIDPPLLAPPRNLRPICRPIATRPSHTRRIARVAALGPPRSAQALQVVPPTAAVSGRDAAWHAL